MNAWALVAEAVVVALLFAGIAQFKTPRGAWRGNLFSIAAFALAVVSVLLFNGSEHWVLTVVAVTVGAVVGYAVAARVTMLEIPAMVAFQHGCGGVAAFLVSFVELIRSTGDATTLLARSSAAIGLVIGAATASGSVIAGAKLSARMRGTPVVLRRHSLLLGLTALVVIVLMVLAVLTSGAATMVGIGAAAIVLSLLVGVLVAIRIGGADMPVLVSFLNASAGLAAAFAGVALSNRLLVVCGATVAASGSILTIVMCRAMNRSLLRIFTGISARGATASASVPLAPAPAAPDQGPTEPPVPADPSATAAPSVGRGATRAPDPAEVANSALRDGTGPAAAPTAPTAPAAAAQPVAQPVALSPAQEAAQALAHATRVVIVPGYGMALAQAQFATVELANTLTEHGTDVQFAIHPVAGRMPGHMNVLLAEADLSYDQLVEMDDINPQLPDTDVALIIGACDVVNPAAQNVPDTPITGMPIIQAHHAKRVIVCNLDDQPGYSGVPNSLYDNPDTLMLLGDARHTTETLLSDLREARGG